MFVVMMGENVLIYVGGLQHRRVAEPRRLCRYKETSAVQVNLMGSPIGKYILAMAAPSTAPAVRAVSSSPGDESHAT
jgi:hypothetical protein